MFFIPRTPSMSPQEFLLFLILINLSVFIKAQDYSCINNGNYTRNSTYDTNLNTLLSSLPSNMDNFGFYNASLGQNPDRANIVALCRGDIQLDSCRTCIQNATVELVNLCPNYKQAILWREYCTLRYSNETLIGNRADNPAQTIRNPFNATSPKQFNEILRTLVDDLRNQAASGGSLLKVAAGNRTAPAFQTIYALLQCTPDITPLDCNICLTLAAIRIPICCDNARGVRILVPSCNIRYEIEPFYNITRIQEVQAMLSAPPPPAPPPSPGNGDGNTTRTVIIIVVPIVLCLILAAFVGILFRCIHIALLCVQENANDRPTMTSVLVMLYSFSATLSLPSQPAFFMSSRFSPDISLSQNSSSTEPELSKSS